MFELARMNPDFMQAEIAYRREKLTGPHRIASSRRWLRLHSRRSTSRHAG